MDTFARRSTIENNQALKNNTGRKISIPHLPVLIKNKTSMSNRLNNSPNSTYVMNNRIRKRIILPDIRTESQNTDEFLLDHTVPPNTAETC